jgi:hypothetical protein
VTGPDWMRMAFPRPDWVITGMPNPDGPGVWLVASKDLNSAEVKAVIDWLPDLEIDWDVIPGRPWRHEYTLTAVMRKFVLIEAADYPAAFRGLFEHWNPEPDARPGIEPPGPHRQLDPG